MSDHTTTYDIIEQNGFWDEELNAALAARKVQDYLLRWRSRIAPQATADVPVLKTYQLPEGGRTALASRTVHELHVLQNAESGDITYEFQADETGTTLRIDGLPADEPDMLMAQAYDMLSEILFQCEQQGLHDISRQPE